MGGSKDEANQCNSHSNSSGSGGEGRREGGRELGGSRDGGRVGGSKDGGMKGGSAERRSFIIKYICSSHNNLMYCGHHLSHVTHTWHIS